MGGAVPCSAKICRHYTISLPPNLPTFGGKLAQDGGKSSAYTGEGNGLHHAPKVLTPAAGRPYTSDETGFASWRERNAFLRKSNAIAQGRGGVLSGVIERPWSLRLVPDLQTDMTKRSDYAIIRTDFF